ncbi:CHAT domain-containing protein [Undibacterium sp. Tian12W]|uniref:CHAT domain-containing protein n=1 Tax=Undibacterium sp. Tian12W TaxID=3413054 RepID=UPI003BEF8149
MRKKFASPARCMLIASVLAMSVHLLASANDAAQDQGVRECASGSYTQALSVLQTAYARADQTADKVKAASALAQTYIQTHQAAKAEPYLVFAFDHASNKLDKAGYAIDVGNWQQQQGHAEQARYYYDTALQLAPSDAAIAISVGLNRQKLELKNLTPAAKLKNLQALWQRLIQAGEQPQAARYSLNLGVQARALGAEGQSLAFQAFDHARKVATKLGQARLQLETLDQLAELYEDAHRYDDALALTDQALLASQGQEAHDLLINVEWRHGRILRAQAKNTEAIAAYQRALEHIEAIRTDIPVEYQDGRSSFRETLEPVYLGLADLLLQTSAQLDDVQKNAQLRRARDVLELLKQTELQDYLGDRCAVDTARANRKAGKNDVIADDTAILYPIILSDRLELLLETSKGMYSHSITMSAAKMRADVLDFGNILKDNLSFKPQAKRLYQALLAPVDAELAQQGISTLVIVPDGVLRLLPFAALHDGQQFAIEKYAIAVVPALSLTNTSVRRRDGVAYKTLLAGMSEPGAVLDKLPGAMVEQLLAANPQTTANGRQVARAVLTRSLRNIPKAGEAAILNKPAQHQQLQQMLALAGVDEEIRTLEKLTSSQTLLNAKFTVAAFSQKVKTGDYQIVHIASHGVFGGTADSTFVMAHDDLITMDNLQGFLLAGSMKNQELELLTLSACETAEGDDRAPLGLSGAALKARARSALGSLWPVSDDAATLLMGQFYRRLAEPATSKAQALQKAQLELMKNNQFSHPFYWAPFIMVGSWL